MGELVKRIVIFIAEKGSKINPSDFLTQDTTQTFIEIARELIKP
jgi:hypothetical protein